MKIFLRYVGDPGYQTGVAEDIDDHQTSVSKVLTKVADQMIEKCGRWIKFPSTPVDVTEARRWHFSMCHATCNADEWFTSVDASWPGSVHDSRIWSNSEICNIAKREFQRSNALLLRDEGYGIAPWLMVPFRNPNTPAEHAYNNLLTKERVIIEPSHTDITIHSSSNHPYTHKIAAYHSYVHRLINVPMNDADYNKELNIIKQIALNNGYNPSLIDSIIKKKQFKKAINQVYPQIENKIPNQTYNSITYIGQLTEDISLKLKKLDRNISFRCIDTLSNLIKNNKSKLNRNEKSGVYKLECVDCPKVYIGQSGRAFKHRDCRA
nr:unnamed protein product [Callosobruchus chinensis]